MLFVDFLKVFLLFFFYEVIVIELYGRFIMREVSAVVLFWFLLEIVDIKYKLILFRKCIVSRKYSFNLML